MITKLGEVFYHATSKDNFKHILESGELRSLQASSRLNPKAKLSVEPHRWGREREEMLAEEAPDKGKNLDKVFLSRDGYEPGYGDYLIRKDLKSPKRSSLINLVPSEFTTRRRLSVRSNAHLIVPDEEVAHYQKQYPKLRRRFIGMTDSKANPVSRLRLLTDVPRKLWDSAWQSKEGADLEATPLKPRDIHRRAFLGGSSGLGIGVPGVKDLDYLVPYTTYERMMKDKGRYLTKFPELAESPFNGGRLNKQVLSGTIKGNDVDITLAHGDSPYGYIKSVKDARKALSPESKAKIIARKKALKDSWLFGSARYKKYKKEIDKKLKLARF